MCLRAPEDAPGVPAFGRISLRQRYSLNLRTVHLLRLITEGWDFTHSACRHAVRTVSSPSALVSGVQSLRIPRSLEVFPADWPHLSHCHCIAVAEDPRLFQQIARFCSRNYNGLGHSYGRRSPGLQFKPCSSPINLPALGRCQPLYVGFPLRRDLCFC